MGQVVVDIGGRNYSLSCRDGDEAHLNALAADIARKAESLTQSLGPMTESRLLLMSALMVADELHDLQTSRGAAWPPRDAPDPAVTERLATLLARAERLADSFDH